MNYFIHIFIFIILFLYLQKNKFIYESLVISPSKLYSSANENSQLCDINNIYINITDYLKIKNYNPLKRPGVELVGKTIRILIEEPEIQSISETNSYCQDKNSITINKTVCDVKEANINGTLELDLIFKLNTYYRLADDKKGYWYDANIINYNMVFYPCSLHKIEWKNRFNIIEKKWINLYDSKIEVPIIYKDISSCNYKSYTNNISCSSNEDCKKYGSLFCNGGFCNTQFYNI